MVARHWAAFPLGDAAFCVDCDCLCGGPRGFAGRAFSMISTSSLVVSGTGSGLSGRDFLEEEAAIPAVSTLIRLRSAGRTAVTLCWF